MASSRKPDVYAMVTDRVIELLEKGTIPWRKPWNGASLHPCNGRTGHQYRGINPFLLQITQVCNGFSDHRWLTYRNAQDAGGNVRKGEKSTLVCFWKWLDIIDRDTSDPRKIPLLKYFRVFNVEQCDGIDQSKLKAQADVYEPATWDAIEDTQAIADGWLDRSGIRNRFTFGGAQAAYAPAMDSLRMPDKDRFESAAEFYCTLFHEMTHSTGHASRLNRIESASFGSDPYAREELVAELGAAFLCGHSGIEGATIENSAAYINGWLRALKNDKKLVVGAAAAAQKASDLILGREWTGGAEDNATQPQIAGV